MEFATTTVLRIGAWRVDIGAAQMTRDGDSVRLEPRMLRLLLCLAERAGDVVGSEELLAQVWPGVIVTPDSVYQAVATLRRLLGDDPKQPRYVATVPRVGYKLIAPVGPWSEADAPALPAAKTTDALLASTAPDHASPESNRTQPAPPPLRPRRRLRALALGVTAVLALLVALIVSGVLSPRRGQADAPAPKSIAVLPFLDLTEAMGEEYFADGMTEELIDRFSKVRGLRVPSPTASFYFKGKQETVAEIAHQLGVVYVLDGSVRKSGSMVRVAARLMRADDGFVLWSETYDRPLDDLLMVQDDIADEVSKALQPTIGDKAVQRAAQ